MSGMSSKCAMVIHSLSSMKFWKLVSYLWTVKLNCIIDKQRTTNSYQTSKCLNCVDFWWNAKSPSIPAKSRPNPAKSPSTLVKSPAIPAKSRARKSSLFDDFWYDFYDINTSKAYESWVESPYSTWKYLYTCARYQMFAFFIDIAPRYLPYSKSQVRKC